MYLEGQLMHGLYTDDGAGIDPEEFSNHYGTCGSVRTRNPCQTGAGQLSDEDLSDVEMENSDADDESMKGLAEQLENLGFHPPDSNMPKAACIPKHSSPFTDTQQDIFIQAFEDVVKEGIISPGYGMLPEEWENGEYLSIEVIRAGRGKNDLQIALPDDIWRPR